MNWMNTAPSFNPTQAAALLSYNKAQLKSSGDIWFVSLAGKDTNSGTSWEDAFRTIIYAISYAGPNDTIFVGPGTFDETANGADGVILDKNYMTLIAAAPVHATFVTNTNTTNGGSVIIARGDGIDVIGIDFAKGETVSDNSIIVKYDGAFGCDFVGTNILVEKATFTGLQFTGGTAFSTFGSPLVGAMGILLDPSVGSGGIGVELDDCIQSGVAGAGTVWIGAGLTIGVVFNASAIANGLNSAVNLTGCETGVQLNPGASNNIINASFTNCATRIVDNSGNGTNETPAVSLITPYAHEDRWPIFTGQGVAADPVSVPNLETDDAPTSTQRKDYFGDTVAIIAPGTITMRWVSNGLEVFAGVANKRMYFDIWYPQPEYCTTRNGGGNWSYTATSLTVQDATVLQTGDRCWVKSNSHPNGEIVDITNIVGSVVTIQTEIRFGNPDRGLRYNHVGGETIYVIERSGLNRLDGHQNAYAAANTKSSEEKRWSIPKDLPPNAGMIARLANIDDNLAASIEINVLFGD